MTEPATIDRSLLDASVAQSAIDTGEPVERSADAATLSPACPVLDVCSDNKPSLLYNVCIDGAPSGAVLQPACIVDPNGILYLAPLTNGQQVMNLGWAQSTNSTLSAADQVRCDMARTTLLADASTPTKCAGGQ